MMRGRLTCRTTRFCAALAIAQCLGSAGVGDEGKEESSLEALNQVICGPRCVHFVLKHYGRDEALSPVVRQMQWPDLSKGSSVRQIEDALQSRGVYTRSIELKRAGSFRPRFPAIVHLRDQHGGDVSLEGHFVVVMPESTRSEAVVWDGLFGVRRETWRDFSRRMTGVVVLTGDEPIEDVDEAMRMRAPRCRWKVCLLGALVLGVVLLIPLGPRWWRGFPRRPNWLPYKEETS
jgi:ABC-type bacteriocin/lantibiotic exporter with double-glycine peptidase domain